MMRDSSNATVGAAELLLLAWRPVHRAAAEEVHVEVRDAFAGVRAVVNDQTVTGFLESLLLGDVARGK